MPNAKPVSSAKKAVRAIEWLESRQLLAAHIAGSSTTYSTIQAAVNAAVAGSTITVDSGSYAESVTVNKRLTILGAEAGVDARTNRRRETGPETTLTGSTVSGAVNAVFNVTANNVTIDGFVLQGVTSSSLTKGAAIVIAPNVSGTQILNNLIQNNTAGIYLSNNSSTNPAIIRGNVFRSNNNAGANGGRAIYTDQTLSGGTLTNVTIDQNAFFFNYGGTYTTKLEAAIAFESTAGAQSQTNLTITNNVFDDNGKALLAINVTGMLFSGNVVTRGRDFYSGIVRFEGNDHNVTITNNNLYNNTGAAVAVDVKGFPGDNSGFVVTNNNIYGNGTTGADATTTGKKLGVVINGNAYDGVFDARNNYWGSTDGPSGDGPGTGDSIYGGPGSPTTGKWAVTTTPGSELFSPWSTTALFARDTSFWGTRSTDGYPIQAEDFNFGGKGIAYNDTTSGNAYGLYRNTDVDITTTTDAGGGYAVANTAVGEWLDYGVTLAQGGQYRLDLRLASAAAGATVRVYVDNNQVGADTAVPSTGSATTFATLAIDNLSITSGNHTIRIMFVKANTAGSTPAFNWMRLTSTSVIAAPKAPTNLTATVTGSTAIQLAWTNTDTTAAGITVYALTSGGDVVPVATLPSTATSYAVTGLAPLTTYTYYVVATNAGGDSPASNPASATTSPADVTPLSNLNWTSATSGWLTPAINTSIKGTPISLRGVIYDTGIGTHADSTIIYNLAGRFNSFTSSVGIDDETAGQGAADFQVWGDGVLLYDSGALTGSSKTATFTVGVRGVTTLKLVATSIDGNIDYAHADWAGAKLLLALPPAPAAPTQLTATPLSGTSVRLDWLAGDTNQTGYTLERSVDNGVTWVAIATPVKPTYTDTAVAAGNTYLYRVRATNAYGESPNSAVASVTLPTTVVQTPLSSLTWDSATVGYGDVQKNATSKGTPISLRGTTYASGIGTHSDSTITYTLAGKYTTFVSDIGIDDDTAGRGSVVFQVIGDGKVLFDSGVLTGSSPVVSLAVNVSGVQSLQLVVTSAGDGIDFDHADWAGATLTS